MSEEQKDPQGVDDFTEPEQVFCEVLTKLAKKISLDNQGNEAVAKLYGTTANLIKSRQSDPDMCTDRVYSFCMAWMAGAISVAESGEHHKAGGLSVTHCGIAFFAGAAIVTVFNLI